MAEYTKLFKQINKDDVDIAGGKGANLGEMFQSGFPVPPGFVVTAESYWIFIKKTGLKKQISEILDELNTEDSDELQEKTKKIRELIIKKDMPEEIKKSIKDAYHKLRSGEKKYYVAVRSSATAEDLPNASFAGQQETFLNVIGDESLIKSVRECWASLFTARATYYRERNDFPHMKVKIAVIIQKMIGSDISGVAFSVHPSTGEEKVIIEAGYGLGDAVVQGSINPDYYEVSKKDWKIIKKKVNKQERMITKTGDNKNEWVDVSEEKQEKQVLKDEQIIQLAKLVQDIHEHYESPQDIEWAVENNHLYIVQSRPVTTIKKKSLEKVKEFSEKSSGKILLSGLGASPGKGTGPVKIIHEASELQKIKKGDILVTEMTNPDMVPGMERAAAIVTNEGGTTSHAAIVSRELGVPCIVGTNKATQVLKDKMIITVDGESGKVIEASEKELEKEKKKEKIKKAEVKRLPKEAPITGTKVYMNLGIPEKMEDYASLPLDGIGLMRIEFLIASKIGMHPNKAIKEGKSDDYINKLAKGVKKVAEIIEPKPLIVRFSDFKTNEYKDLKGGEDYEPHEDNPMIGWRGCSRYVSKDFEKAFRLECKAIKKVRDSGHKNVYVMLPFVRTISEVKDVLKIMKSEGLERNKDFKVYLMAEVPSIAMLADQFAELCDGFSIGSNDLTQLTLGVDRDSEKLGRMGYFDERNPAVLETIKRIIKLAHKKNITVSICGQAPSVYPEITEFLVRNGIDSISVNPDVVLKTKYIVARVEHKILLENIRKE